MTSAHLDHIAIAAERVADLWPRYAGDLSGTWGGGAPDSGFSFFHLVYGSRRVEVLEPKVEESDFLRRFLDRNGPGPHHITFKIDDIERVLADLDGNGFRPVSVDLSDPTWKEAFVHPKDGPGIVVQVAQAAHGGPSGPPPGPLPDPAMARPADFVRITHGVASIEDASRLFVNVLGGQETGRGTGSRDRWVDLTWEHDATIRLLEPADQSSPLAEWIGGSKGRLHHLVFAVDDPSAVPGAAPLAGHPELYEVAPEDNLGVRLLLQTR